MLDLKRLVRSLPQGPLPLIGQIGIAGGCTAVAAGVHLVIEPLLDGAPFITFFPAVLLASAFGGIWAGVLTLLSSAAVAEYLWLEPYRAFGLTTAASVTLLTYLSMGGIVVFAAHLLQVAVRMARHSEERAGLVAREMQHRIGNKLALVQAIARLSARHANTLEEFQELFSARLQALSESQAAVGPEPDLPADLGALLRVVLRPFDEQRISMSGPLIGVDDRDRPMLALLVHELGTNAVKHGSLSVPAGRISLSWSLEERGLRVEWREIGGPPVRAPARSGFGTSLAKAAFPPDRGDVSLDYKPDGLLCTLRLLVARPIGRTRAETRAALAAVAAAPGKS